MSVFCLRRTPWYPQPRRRIERLRLGLLVRSSWQHLNPVDPAAAVRAGPINQYVACRVRTAACIMRTSARLTTGVAQVVFDEHPGTHNFAAKQGCESLSFLFGPHAFTSTQTALLQEFASMHKSRSSGSSVFGASPDFPTKAQPLQDE